MDITYSTTWRLFSFLFSSSLPLFSQPLARDTLPWGAGDCKRTMELVLYKCPDIEMTENPIEGLKSILAHVRQFSMEVTLSPIKGSKFSTI